MADDRRSYRRVPRRLATAARAATDAVERAAFRVVVVLPLVSVPLLVVGFPGPARRPSSSS